MAADKTESRTRTSDKVINYLVNGSFPTAMNKYLALLQNDILLYKCFFFRCASE